MYTIYIVDSEDIAHPKDTSFFTVKNIAIDSIRTNTLKELVGELITILNDQTLSDMNWYFLCDEKEGIILHY